MADHLISDAEIARYSRTPSLATVTAVASLQNAIRDVLGSEYETFLQGSYRNDTSIRDLNDVDIVAVLKGTFSGPFTGRAFPQPRTWPDIFGDVARRLATSASFRGKTSFGNRCVRVTSSRQADVVPAVRITRYDEDPIAIYSFREQKEKLSYPRTHYDNSVAKHKRTGQTYKAVVRMFKNWAANHWPSGSVARSFHLESLVYSVPDDRFSSDLGLAFFRIAYYIETLVPPSPAPVVLSVAGDKDILSAAEWNATDYARFHAQVGRSTTLLAAALEAKSQSEASKFWRAAFNE